MRHEAFLDTFSSLPEEDQSLLSKEKSLLSRSMAIFTNQTINLESIYG